MEKVYVYGVEFSSFSNEEIASLQEKIVAHPSFKKAIKSFQSIKECEMYSDLLNELIMKYAIAIGDLSLDDIDLIIDGITNNIKEGRKIYDPRRPNDVKYFRVKNSIYPLAIEQWKNKLGVDDSLNGMLDVLTAISIQSNFNTFLTHSFNGALKEKVEDEGLNVNNELFKEEFDLLRSRLDTPYPTGDLCFADFGGGTYSYTHRSPERVWKLVTNIKRCDDQTNKEYAHDCIEATMEQFSNLSIEEQMNIRNCLTNILDFYTSSEEVCIAFKKINKLEYTEEKANKTRQDLEKSIVLPLGIKSPLSRQLPIELVKEFNEILRDKSKGIDDIDAMISKIKSHSPKSKLLIENHLNNVMVELFSTKAIKNYTYSGNNWGNNVPGGYLPREEFAIASYVDPINEYATNKKVELTKNK